MHARSTPQEQRAERTSVVCRGGCSPGASGEARPRELRRKAPGHRSLSFRGHAHPQRQTHTGQGCLTQFLSTSGGNVRRPQERTYSATQRKRGGQDGRGCRGLVVRAQACLHTGSLGVRRSSVPAVCHARHDTHAPATMRTPPRPAGRPPGCTMRRMAGGGCTRAAPDSPAAPLAPLCPL